MAFNRHPPSLISETNLAIALIVGFALGYGVREWLSRRKAPSRRDNGGKRLWGITLSGMTHFAELARCAQPGPVTRRLGGSGRSLCVGSVGASYSSTPIALISPRCFRACARHRGRRHEDTDITVGLLEGRRSNFGKGRSQPGGVGRSTAPSAYRGANRESLGLT